MYTPIKLDISPDQHDKLKNAVQHGKAVSMKVIINNNKKAGRHKFLLTHAQTKRLQRAKLMKKSSVTIHLSKKQVIANTEHRGGFLGTLIALASKVLPTLLSGLATGLISGSVDRAVSGRGLYLSHQHRAGGNGLYLHKSGHSVKVIPIRGKGLQLVPKKLHGVCKDGLYVKQGSQVHEGNGLLLGKNSPFKNIPILGLLL